MEEDILGGGASNEHTLTLGLIDRMISSLLDFFIMIFMHSFFLFSFFLLFRFILVGQALHERQSC